MKRRNSASSKSQAVGLSSLRGSAGPAIGICGSPGKLHKGECRIGIESNNGHLIRIALRHSSFFDRRSFPFAIKLGHNILIAIHRLEVELAEAGFSQAE